MVFEFIVICWICSVFGYFLTMREEEVFSDISSEPSCDFEDF